MLLFDVLPNIITMCKFVVDNKPPITSCIICAVVVKHQALPSTWHHLLLWFDVWLLYVAISSVCILVIF
jgi:hypothetical protein